MATLKELYTQAFSNLHANKRLGKVAPHKAVLLLSVIDLIENGSINSPYIKLTDELVETFNKNWARYVGRISCFSPDICKPFFHLQHEPFWCLREKEEYADSMVAEYTPGLFNKNVKELPREGYSLMAMRTAFECAEIDSALFELLRHQEARAALRVVLISNYMQGLQTEFSTIGGLIIIPIFSLMAC